MANNLAGDCAELVDNCAQTHTTEPSRLTVMQRSVKRQGFVADQAQSIKGDSRQGKKELVCGKVLAWQKLHVHVCLELTVKLLTCGVISV